MSELKKMTRMGSDSRKLAALLQKKAPKGHMLAYINQEEADLLKARGGSGKPHADTGIPSFEGEDIIPTDFGEGGAIPNVAQQNPDLYAGGQLPAAGTSTMYGQSEAGQPFVSDIPAAGAAPTGAALPTSDTYAGMGVSPSATGTGLGTPVPLNEYGQPYVPVSEQLARTPSAATDLTTPTAAQAAGKAEEGGLSKDTLTRLGLAGGLGLIGMSTAKRAQQAGRAGAQQMQALAAPYQQAGQAAQAAAQRGELMPMGQQSLQAAQAQIAQDVTRRGGVGAEQAATQIEALRQQLLQQQYDYGLKLSGIGDNIALGAIQTGLQADQQVNQLTNSFYSNMAYIASGMSPGLRIG
jgi:hypothetical protein